MARSPVMAGTSSWAIVGSMVLIGACAATPAAAPTAPPAPASARPAPAPAPAPQTGKGCSVWSGGPLGDAPPPAGYDPHPCGPGAHCECGAQAGYSCSGTCQPD